MANISSLVPGIIQKLRGRTDRTLLIPGYIQKALLDITENYEFEDLKVRGPVTNFIVGQSEYPLIGGNNDGVSGNPFIYAADIRLTFIISWFCWFSTNVIATNTFVGNTGTQSTGFEIKQRSLRVVEPISKISGLPTICCVVGKENKQGKIIVGFMPDQKYSTQMTYQRQHPFPNINPNATAQQAFNILSSQELFIDKDWFDIVEYAAAEKACDDLGMTDVGVLYHQKLYGNPSQKIPGLITEKFSMQDRMKSQNEGQLKPVVRRYC